MQRLSENDADGHFNSSLVKDRHFKFGKRPRLDYDKYLLGESYRRLKNARKLSPIAISNYSWYVYHLCKEYEINTDEIVARYSKSGQYSPEFQEMVERHIMRLGEDVDKGLIKAQKVGGARSAIRKFATLNGITINWDLISEYVPPIDNNAKDEAYTIEQIKNILDCGVDLRVKVAVLFMTTGGLRREAIVELVDGDVQPIYFDGKLVAARVVAYNEYKQRYITFVTPEAFRTYERYINTRKRYGEIFNRSSPVIIKRFNVKGKRFKIDNSPIAPSTLDGLMIDAAIKAGVRIPSPHYKNRYVNKACHAFRKTFESILLNATSQKEGELIVNPVIAVRLLGDNVKTELGLGVIDHYRRSDPLQRNPLDPNNEYTSLLHEYKKVISDLTINDEDRVKVENEKLKLDIKNMNTINTEIEAIKRQMAIQNRAMLNLAKNGVKFPPNSRVLVLNDFDGNEGLPIVLRTDQNGEIDSLDLDELQEITKFESLDDKEQLELIRTNDKKALIAAYDNS